MARRDRGARGRLAARRIAPLAAALLLLGAASAAAEAKHVFLFIGDGMGLAQTQAAQLFVASQESDETPARPAALSYTTFPVVGLASTQSADSSVTDSAAAATAMASGAKAANGTLNLDPGTGAPLAPLTRAVKAAGRAVGIVSTCPLNHATPAAFYASAQDRYDYYGIGLQALEPGLIDFLGGGAFADDEGEDGDEESLDELARARGFRVLRDAAEIRALSGGGQSVIAEQPGAYGAPFMDYELDRRALGSDALSLREIVKAGLRVFADRDFFMMAESGMVDTACAETDAASAVYEVLALSDAVLSAVEFYRDHPDDTLIVVLADHETGGMTLTRGLDASQLAVQRASYQRIHAEERRMEREGASSADMLAAVTGRWFSLPDGLSDSERERFEEAWEAACKDELSDEEETRYRGLNPMVYAACRLTQRRADIEFQTTGHTAQHVPVYALGEGAELFAGLYDNTQIHDKLLEAMGL